MLLGAILSKAYTDDDIERVIHIFYVFAVCLIMYVITCTKLNEDYVLSLTIRYQANPSEKNIR